MIETNKGSTNPLKICVYGESGVGKTSLIKTLPANCQVLIIDLERKTNVLDDSGMEIIRLQFESYKDLIDSMPKIIEKAKAFDIVVIDSLSDMRAWLYHAAKRLVNGDKDVILDKVEQPIWGFVANKMADFINGVKMLNKPMLFLGRQTLDANNRATLDLGSKLSADVPAAMDVVFPLVKNGAGKRAIIINNERYFTRLHNEKELMERFSDGVAPADLSIIFNFGG